MKENIFKKVENIAELRKQTPETGIFVFPAWPPGNLSVVHACRVLKDEMQLENKHPDK